LHVGGRIDLDQDVNVLLKDWRLASDYPNQPVTLRHLLTHQAGTGPEAFMGFHETRQVPTLVEILNGHSWYVFGIRRPVKVVEPPESGYRYSGGGYCVVQKALEDSQGESFAGVMRRNLLGPLRMAHSCFRQVPDEERIQNTAHGYGWLNGIVFRGRWRIYPESAAAGLWTTPSDLARMIVAVQRAFAGDSTGPLSPEAAREFLRPQFEPQMGMGVFLGGDEGDRCFFHGGANWGYVSKFSGGVTNGRGWVIMSNGKSTDYFDRILEVISEEFHWETDAPAVTDKEGVQRHNKPLNSDRKKLPLFPSGQPARYAEDWLSPATER
jgi:CubicO group peptidase (beta-lactamase class C family)